MADFLTGYSITQPNKLAMIDDRPDGTVRSLTFAQLNERSNRLANVLLGMGVLPGESKVVWCGQNSIGLVLMVNAARKLGVTAVPLNYRLSDEEAAYVVDHCDATVVYVDAEFAPVEVAGPFDKRELDAQFVRERETLLTRGWRRLREVAGGELPIIDYPLAEFRKQKDER